ncbi:hypothetical protein SUGI_0297940 [Cryptomeria japonica]|uniref:uncharacterized protein LOC131034215 n=1 Tax=Cryptomeria japonica TaxID=3369 RepID=UPI002408D3B0|nr:uncharacterized protein LOC131034215 [Cryptomeria japonica]GLJ17204.1 hypothetical protein SUGI_0297940 [Cryptomeria japonica]
MVPFFLIIGLFFLPTSLLAETNDSSSASLVQRKWTNVPPPPAVVCTSCVTCENPCNPVPPPPPPPCPPPPKPPQIECPPPPKPPQIECPPPPSGFHYIFAPPYPYVNYPYDYFNAADRLNFHGKFSLVCLVGFVLYIFV